MRIGVVGTGKLGLPVSLVYATKGHELLCYDVDKKFYDATQHVYDHMYHEELCPDNKISLKEWLPSIETLKYSHVDIDTLVENSDIIFVAIQTPHDKKYEGIDRLPETRVDFDYTYLKSGLELISNTIKKDTPVVIISTVLPGTIRKQILPLLNPHIKLCYNPYFIAMGTVAHDCLNPEFILLGNHDESASQMVTAFYKTICNAPVFSTTIENAELIKVCYNTFISTKVAMANTIMELCHHSPNTNCDTVIDALSLADKRLISPAYLRGGMGDGGGCHPRDNIALSWYSRNINMKFDWFESIMLAREKQCEFLADLIEEQYAATRLPIIVLGLAFKADTAITTGSSTVLLTKILQERNIPFAIHDPLVYKDTQLPTEPGIYFIGCKHMVFNSYTLPDTSIVIDPHRTYEKIVKNGTYIPIGDRT